jgi:cell division protein ZapA
MAQVSVAIAGKTYRIACDDGDEPRLDALAQVVDTQVGEMRQRFGEIGDRRLLIMAAIGIADELVDMSRRVRMLESEVARHDATAAEASSQESFRFERAVTEIEAAAELIERIALEMHPQQKS